MNISCAAVLALALLLPAALFAQQPPPVPASVKDGRMIAGSSTEITVASANCPSLWDQA